MESKDKPVKKFQCNLYSIELKKLVDQTAEIRETIEISTGFTAIKLKEQKKEKKKSKRGSNINIIKVNEQMKALNS